MDLDSKYNCIKIEAGFVYNPEVLTPIGNFYYIASNDISLLDIRDNFEEMSGLEVFKIYCIETDGNVYVGKISGCDVLCIDINHNREIVSGFFLTDKNNN